MRTMMGRQLVLGALAALAVSLATGCSEPVGPSGGVDEVSALAAKGKKPPSEEPTGPSALPALVSRGASRAHAVNDAGLIVGEAEAANGLWRPVRWSPAGSGWAAPEPLADGPSGGAALGITKAGIIAGYLGSPSTERTAAVWLANGTRVDLGSLETGYMAGINAENTIAGSIAGVPFAWRQVAAGQWVREPLPLGSYLAADVLGIANGNLALGSAFDSRGEHAVTWSYGAGGWHGPEPLPEGALYGTVARDRSSAGIVGAGHPVCQSCNFAAVYWSTPSAQPLLIPKLDVRDNDGATAISASGQVVGNSTSRGIGPTTAFWWTASSGRSGLPPLGRHTASEARAINGVNLVVGESRGSKPPAVQAVVWKLP